jgi:hypothetical protein
MSRYRAVNAGAFREDLDDDEDDDNYDDEGEEEDDETAGACPCVYL